MKRHFSAICLCVGLSSLLPAAAVVHAWASEPLAEPKPEVGRPLPSKFSSPSDVLTALQGTWRVITSQVGDEKTSLEELKRRKVTITGDKLVYEFGNERQEKREGTIKLDPKTQAFDWNIPLGNATALAIYDRKGDTLKIGFGNDGLVRPKNWDIDKDNVVWLLVLQRDKSDANAQANSNPGWVTDASTAKMLDSPAAARKGIQRGRGQPGALARIERQRGRPA